MIFHCVLYPFHSLLNGFSSAWGFQNLFWILFSFLICRHNYWHLFTSSFPFDLTSAQKICKDVCPSFYDFGGFSKKSFHLVNASIIFVSFFNRALLKFLAFKYFLEIFQLRHLPTLKIGKKFSRFSAWSGLHKMAVILIHVRSVFSEIFPNQVDRVKRWNFLLFYGHPLACGSVSRRVVGFESLTPFCLASA